MGRILSPQPTEPGEAGHMWDRGGRMTWPQSDSAECRGKDLQAEERAGQVQQPLEQVGAPLVAHPQAAATEEPRKTPLDDPPVPPQSLGGVDAAASDARGDAPATQGTTQRGRVVGFIGVEFGRALARTTRLPPWADDRRDGINQRKQLGRVVGIGRRETDRQRDAVPVDDQVVLGARLAAVDRVPAGLLAPFLARTLRESTLARVQSTAAASPSQLSNVSCSRSQTAAFCQSRSRRQQVVPLPQPSSFGSSRHGQPVRRTKTMPPRAARSWTRGRPPFGFGGSLGSRGSMASQRSSGTRDAAFMVRHHAIVARVLKHGLSLTSSRLDQPLRRAASLVNEVGANKSHVVLTRFGDAVIDVAVNENDWDSSILGFDDRGRDGL